MIAVPKPEINLDKEFRPKNKFDKSGGSVNAYRKASPLNSIAALLIAQSLALCACENQNEDQTIIKKEVLRNRQIKIYKQEDSGTYAHIVPGDSTIFYYSRYESHGSEGSGSVMCFNINENVANAEYATAGNKKEIIRYSTGFLPNEADTVESYGFKIEVGNQSITIVGMINGENISGVYRPKD